MYFFTAALENLVENRDILLFLLEEKCKIVRVDEPSILLIDSEKYLGKVQVLILENELTKLFEFCLAIDHVLEDHPNRLFFLRSKLCSNINAGARASHWLLRFKVQILGAIQVCFGASLSVRFLGLLIFRGIGGLFLLREDGEDIEELLPTHLGVTVMVDLQIEKVLHQWFFGIDF